MLSTNTMRSAECGMRNRSAHRRAPALASGNEPSRSTPHSAFRIPHLLAGALLLGLIASFACAPTTDPPPALAYVTNEVSQDLSVIDVAADRVITTIPLGARARGVKVSPDGRLVYVALSGSPRCPPTMPDAECAKLEADKSKDGIAEIDAASHKILRVLPG